MEGGYALYDSPIGRCAIAWRGFHIVRTALPEADDAALRARFGGLDEAEPPPFVASAIVRLVALLAGARDDLADLPVNFGRASSFEKQVWEAARRIPVGEVRSYGTLAEEIGAPGAGQAVGRALGRNPVPIVVPCHRILAADGRSGGFSAPGGISTKFRILQIEKAQREGDAGLFGALPLAVKPGI